jgi:RNA polymerase sigma-70 factor (ECF subfamily)
VPDADAHNLPDDWRPWFDRHSAALVLFARQFLSHRQDAEDAVQAAFVRFWRTRQTARDPAAYLFACVRTAAVDLRRARQTRRRHETAAAAPALAGPEALDDRRRLLEAALARLPEEQREVVVLKVWSPPPGLTFAQIAEAVGISANTAASRYRYGITRLQALLSPEVTRE